MTEVTGGSRGQAYHELEDETAFTGQIGRLRLARSEVDRLRDTGLIEESVDFGGGEVLVYRLKSREEAGPARAGFRYGAVTVSVSTEAAQAWAGSDEVGIYAQYGAVSISIEKDFRCLTRTREEGDLDAYSHPGRPSETRS